jgi:hypothetical protein
MNDVPWEFCMHLFKFHLLPQRKHTELHELYRLQQLGQWKVGGYNGHGIWLGLGDRYASKVVWKSLGTCILGRLRSWEDNIKKDVREIDCEDW